MSDPQTVIRMLNACRQYNLSGADYCSHFPLETLARDFNGIGPECFHEKLRKAIDNLTPDLQPVAFVHDVRFAHGDGTFADFTAANSEFAANGKKIADAKYAWWRPMRYIVRREASVFAKLCQSFGWFAYVAACTKNPAAIAAKVHDGLYYQSDFAASVAKPGGRV